MLSNYFVVDGACPQDMRENWKFTREEVKLGLARTKYLKLQTGLETQISKPAFYFTILNISLALGSAAVRSSSNKTISVLVSCAPELFMAARLI
jgi:hypothetical protein